MKKFLVTFAATMMLLTIAVSAMAAYGPGDTVDVTISISTSSGCWASIGFSYDNSALEFVSATGGTVAPQSSNGKFIFGSGTSAIGSASGKITFKIKETAKPGTYTISAKLSECYDINENDVPASVSGGTIKVECPHAVTMWKETIAPSCTEKGEEGTYCKVCGEFMGETRNVEALGHADSTWTIVLESTCFEQGKEELQCTRCGEKTEERDVAALGHDNGEWVAILEPTCVDKGKKKLQCTRCNEKLEEQDIEPLGHADSTWITVLDPTCIENGKEELQCPRCNEKYDERDIESLGHKCEKWTTKVAPTCTENGIEELYCIRCNEKQDERETDSLGHDNGTWRVTKQPTADEDGVKELHCTRCDELLDTESFRRVMMYNQSVCSQGFQFRDKVEGLTDKWYMFTPVDVSKDGVTEIPLIAANRYIVGKLIVTVAEGKLKLEYNISHRVELNDITFTIFTSLADVTEVEIGSMKNYEFGQEISISDELNGSNVAMIWVLGHANYDSIDTSLAHLSKKSYENALSELEPLMK